MDYTNEELFFLTNKDFLNKKMHKAYTELWKSFSLTCMNLSPNYNSDLLYELKQKDQLIDRITLQSKYCPKLLDAFFIVDIHRVLEQQLSKFNEKVFGNELNLEFTIHRKPNEFDVLRQELSDLINKDQKNIYTQVDGCLEILAESKALRNEFLHEENEFSIPRSELLVIWQAAVKLLLFIDRKSLKN
jgi:hypothetical protein